MVLSGLAERISTIFVTMQKTRWVIWKSIHAWSLLQDIQSCVIWRSMLLLFCAALLNTLRWQHPVVWSWSCVSGFHPSLIFRAERVCLACLCGNVRLASPMGIKITGSQVAPYAGRLSFITYIPLVLPLLQNRLQQIDCK